MNTTIGLAAVTVGTLAAWGADKTSAPPALREIAPDIFMFRDAGNVYCIRSGNEALLIEAGSGAVTNALKKIGVKRVAWVLHTHAHRDLCQGDAALAAAGAKIAVPDGTRAQFEDAATQWYDRELLNAFDYGDKYFLPLRNIPVQHVLTNGEVFVWKNVRLRVLATPGHTAPHLAFVLERGGKKYVFCGDAICTPGKVWELDALQSTYEEFIQGPPALKRVPELQASLARLRAEQPTLLLPAHGVPFGNCGAGIELLEQNLATMMAALANTNYFGGVGATLPQVQALQTCAITYLLRGSNGLGVVIDPSVDRAPDGQLLGTWLKNQMGTQRVAVVLITHYHADHLAMAPAVLQHYGAALYTHEKLREILEEPLRVHRPCVFPQGMRVARSFKDGEGFALDGLRFTFYDFPGHTYWHQAVLAEVDGQRILFTGDAIDDYRHVRSIDCCNYNPISDSAGAMRCAAVLEKTKPDYIATGHWGIHPWKAAYVPPLRAWVRTRNAALTALIGQAEPNLGYDVHWARLDSFRNVVSNQLAVTLTARVHNHLAVQGTARLVLTLPAGWRATPAAATVTLPAQGDGQVAFRVEPARDAAPTRHMIGLDVTLNGQRYGELGMAYVDIGADYSVERRKPTWPMSGLLDPGYGKF